MQTHIDRLNQEQAWTPLESQEQQEEREREAERRIESGELMSAEEMGATAVRMGLTRPRQ